MLYGSRSRATGQIAARRGIQSELITSLQASLYSITAQASLSPASPEGWLA